jgi:hypothetical protein
MVVWRVRGKEDMITGCIVSPWATRTGPLGPERYPKVQDDYTLERCSDVSAVATAGSFGNPSQPSERAGPAKDDPTVAVEVRCAHEVWAALILDTGYGPALWYQEDGKQRRYLTAPEMQAPVMKAAPKKRPLQVKKPKKKAPKRKRG